VSATWYDENYPYRRAVSVDNTAAGAGGTVDITFTMPVDDDLFWENVQADGDDIRICDADGFTLLTFDTASFNKTTRAGSFEVDAYAAPAGEMCVIYIYWGYASATDGRSSFVPASALTGYVDQRKPGPLVFEAAEERQAALRPRNVVAKSSLETKPVYLDFTRRMAKRADPYAARDLYEGIDYTVISAVSQGGAITSIWTDASTRIIDGSIVAVSLTGGSDGVDYALRVRAVTHLGNIFVATLFVRVRDTDDV
jgi:hypothetical protein